MTENTNQENLEGMLDSRDKVRRNLGKEFEVFIYSGQDELRVNTDTYVDDMTKGCNPSHLESLSEYYSHAVPWFLRFNGKLPASWESWSMVASAFEFAGRINAQLSSRLVDAGVSHYHPSVVRATVKNQKLTLEQFAEALKTDQAGAGDEEYRYIDYQNRFHLSQIYAREAKKLVDAKMQARREAYKQKRKNDR